MSDNSPIEWCDATPLKVRAAAASRLGLSLADYDSRREDGQKWCSGCKAWQPRADFFTDQSRGDGLAKWCRTFSNDQGRSRYVPRARPAAGRRFVQARDDDQAQARRRVNYLVDVGLLPHPNTVPCTDCGHVWTDGQRRHEYDHHLGYAAQRHEDVEAVCTTCHHQRETERRAI